MSRAIYATPQRAAIAEILRRHGIEADSLYKKTNLLSEKDLLACMNDVSRLRAALRDIYELSRAS